MKRSDYLDGKFLPRATWGETVRRHVFALICSVLLGLLAGWVAMEILAALGPHSDCFTETC